MSGCELVTYWGLVDCVILIFVKTIFCIEDTFPMESLTLEEYFMANINRSKIGKNIYFIKKVV